ncbi:hypothetical protein HPB48_002057 [Haemaphysalis longicornis]|uniref:Uncharacterized protein n=1 Tax=Haemaphysalis longicornis TaxID=44386 RepID=A0A9J6FH00_HAELO|nr:hypothetical protein HPB48_002057 [Haemaphysalis longicornis]
MKEKWITRGLTRPTLSFLVPLLTNVESGSSCAQRVTLMADLPLPVPSFMEHERRLRGCLRAAITKAITALEALLEDPAAPEHRIQGFRHMRSRRLLLIGIFAPFVTAEAMGSRNAPRMCHQTRSDGDCMQADIASGAASKMMSHPDPVHAIRSAHSAGQGGPSAVPRPSHSASSVVTASTSVTRPTPVYLQTCRAWATGPNGQLLVMVLQHTGSQRTFIRRDVSRSLGCSVESFEEFKLETFGKSHPTTAQRCPRV